MAISNPVTWSASATNIEGNIWKVTVTGIIEPGYHIYDTAEYEYGANSTVITIDGGDAAQAVGELEILSPVEHVYDDILEFEIGTISGKAVFAQDVELNGRSADLDVTVEWMACTETACTPLDDITLPVHIGAEGHSPAWFWGLGTGFIVGLLGVMIGKKLASKKK